MKKFKKFKFYRRSSGNIWGDLKVEIRYVKLVKYLRGSKGRINEGWLLRKLIFRIDIIAPRKKFSRVNFRQKMFKVRSIIRRFYGMKNKMFKKAKVYRKWGFAGLYFSIERRLDIILYRATFVKSVKQGEEWIKFGNVMVNGEVMLNSRYVIEKGDIIGIRGERYADAVGNILKKMYGKCYVMPSKKLYEINYKMMTVCVYKDITSIKYPIRIKGLRSYKKE